MPCSLCNSFQGSSAETCYCCRILLKGVNGCLQQRERNFTQVIQLSFLFLYCAWEGEIKDCDKTIGCTFADGTNIDIEFFTLKDDNCPCPDAWDDVPVGARTSPETSSKEAFEQACKWLGYCDDEYHGNEPSDGEDPALSSSYCSAYRQVSAPTALPTRVLDVGRHDGKIKVIQGAGKTGKYLCLSHCWGPQQIITTTNATLEDRMREIRLDELPATFSDAILMTRRFEIDYIWIDSLCIVQDDVADWERESAQMASIYHSAYLTLAATKSSSSAGGLFTRTPDFEVSGATPAGEDYLLVFREMIHHELSHSASTASRFPLMTRAWVYQERILSLRILHFGYYELFFECASGAYCECENIGYLGYTDDIPLPNPKLMYSSALESTIKLRTGKLSNKLWVKKNSYYIGRVWRSLAMFYSGLALTIASDRLPAISGVARTFSEKTKSPYLAGLFKHMLLDDLLWATFDNRKPRPLEWRAPSWSWASIDTHISYNDGLVIDHVDYELEKQAERIEFATVDHSECVPAGLDPFGRVKSASLRLTSQLLPGNLLLAADLGTFQRSVYSVEIGGRNVAPRIWPDYNLSCAGPYQVLAGTKVFCLRMIEEVDSKVAISLVLRRVPNETSRLFERIGFLEIDPIPTHEVDGLRPEDRDLVSEAFDNALIETVEVI
ncbi:heterokaryon incompatibility protein-domain-containing protein [Nemania sp. NC0429]|nr:heterokaryon incompatibility protein-domain-containing protein [Nemania sp. NC0429]